LPSQLDYTRETGKKSLPLSLGEGGKQGNRRRIQKKVGPALPDGASGSEEKKKEKRELQRKTTKDAGFANAGERRFGELSTDPRKKRAIAPGTHT